MRNRIHKHPFLILIICGTLCLTRCEKTSKQQDKPVVTESSELKVSIPEIKWKETVEIQIETNSDNQNREALTRIVEENLVAAIQPNKSVRVLIKDKMKRVDSDYLVRGKINWKEDKIDVQFQLIDNEDGASLWDKSYSENIESVLTVSESAAFHVHKMMDGQPDYSGTKSKSVNKDVFLKYLAGKASLAKRTRTDNGQAIQHFKSAFRADTTFALALTGLAESYLQIHQQGWDRGVVWIRLAQDATEKAIQIDRNLTDGYVQLGNALLAWGDFHQAEKQFRKAIDLNSSLPEAWIGMGIVFSHFGLYEPCLSTYNHALSLRSDLDIYLSRVMILIGNQNYKDSKISINKLIQNYSDQKYLHSFAALIYLYKDDLRAADKAVQQGLQSEKMQPFSHAVQAMIFARQKKFDDALVELEFNVKPYAGQDPSLSTAVAAVYSLIGQRGQAIQWLEKAVSLGYQEYPWLVHDPNLQNLNSDQRFQNLMANLKSQWETHRQTYWSP